MRFKIGDKVEMSSPEIHTDRRGMVGIVVKIWKIQGELCYKLKRIPVDERMFPVSSDYMSFPVKFEHLLSFYGFEDSNFEEWDDEKIDT
jgi:hypothetical protein